VDRVLIVAADNRSARNLLSGIEDAEAGSAKLEFGLLGPLLVRRGETVMTIPAGKQRALLAALLLNNGRVVPIDQLAEVLWDAAPPRSARASLHNYVKRLRKMLGDADHRLISTHPHGYQVDVAPDALDVSRFARLTEAARADARTGSWAASAQRLGQALSLWRGQPLADVDSGALAATDVPRLAEERLQALEARIDADLRTGRHAEVIPELKNLAGSHPLREHIHALLMLALYRDGQQAAAHAAYRTARDVLIGELGVEPGQELRTLQQQILQADPSLASPPAAPPDEPSSPGPPAPAVRYSLPPDIPSFFGRDEETELVTSTGAICAIDGLPGLGKTTLAIHCAHLLRPRFPDRQLFIDLHGHTPGLEPVSPEAALAGLLTAVGVDARSLPASLEGRIALWRDQMAGQKALLVLDNAASSDQVVPLLPGGDGWLVLVTSRRHLGDLPGTVIPILLDALSPDQGEAMFLRLAPRAAGAPAERVAELVRLAGCLPLAISLLARVFARHPCWNLADLIRETRASLLTLAAEKSSIASAFDISYQSLGPGQQQFFRRLGLHPGSTIDAYAAAALTSTVTHEAQSLLDVLHSEGLLTEVAYRRYGMHDLIRRYARERALADPVAGRDQSLQNLLDYYQHAGAIAEARLARQTRTCSVPGASMTPPEVPHLADRAQALSWARAERGNLLACLDHATRASQFARIVALTAAIASPLRHDGPWAEATTRHAAAVKAARRLRDRPGEAGALNELGAVQHLAGDFLAAAAALEEALSIHRDLGDRQGQANVLCNLGPVRWRTDDYPAATAALEDALSIHRDLGDRQGQAGDLNELGVVRLLTGDYPGAAAALEGALSIHRDLGDRHGQARDLNELGVTWRLTGNFPGAAAALEEALSIHRELGDRLGQAKALSYLGATRRQTGDYPGAAAALEEALHMNRDLGNRGGQVNALGNLGSVRRLTKDFPGAAEALEEALAISRDIGHRGSEVNVLNDEGTLSRARGDFDRAVACHQQALDVARQIDSPWDEAHALAGLGRCALAAGHTKPAEARLRQAWEIFRRLGAAEATDVAAELDGLNGAHPAAVRH
jgi:DNA-binding SARP family transcriptional activator/tetratricopeptide (TPR) repeat protein